MSCSRDNEMTISIIIICNVGITFTRTLFDGAPVGSAVTGDTLGESVGF